MNGNCYSLDGVNPTLTTNKGEGNRIAIPVITPERANKRQNGRRFKEDGEESFTLTSRDRHGVAIPVTMTGHNMEEQDDIARCLNANDQIKVFGANQKRTKVATSIGVVDDQGRTKKKCDVKDTVPTLRRESHGNEPKAVFAIDKGVNPEERGGVANCITAREDRGLSNRKQEGTLVCVKVDDDRDSV